MANYSVDIEVGLKGTERLRDLRSNIDVLATKINKINSYADVFKAPLQNLQNYNKALREATEALSKAELGTKDEADAIKLYVQALGDAEGAQRRRINLIEEEIEAQRRLQVQQTKSSRTIELGPGGPGFSGGFSAADRARANQAALEKQNAGRRETLELLNREVLFEIRLQNIRERNATLVEKQKRQGNVISNAVIGGAFPLLFGQGPGAAFGGALGGGIGGRLGGQAGFGGSLVGTFAGQATIDFAINSAVQLGTALRKPTQNIQELIKFLGIAGTELEANITILQSLGYESSASAIALAKLEQTLSAEGYKNVGTLTKNLTELDNSFSRLKLAVAALAAGPLSRFFDDLADFIKFFVRAGGVKGLVTSSPERLQALDRQIQGERTSAKQAAAQQSAKAEQAAQKIITAEQSRQLALASAQFSLEKDRLSLTRTALAARQGDIELLRISNELEKKRTELTAARVAKLEKSKLLQMEQDVRLLEQQRGQAQAARQNAIVEAQRQLEKDLLGLEIQKQGVSIEINNLVAERVALQRGEAAGMTARLDTLNEELQSRSEVLAYQRDIALLGVNEVSVRTEINELYKGQLTQLLLEINNRKEAIKQQQAQYNLSQLQIQQQRELSNLQTKTQYALQISTLKAESDPRFLGLFGGSRRTQEIMQLEQQATLSTMTSQLTALQAQAAVPGISPDTLLNLQQQTKALQDQIAIYREYQPALIQATVAQQKFNETMALTNPIVDGVFESFTAVASATKTAEQAFADFLMSVSNMLFDTVKQMISQYIALGIARQIAGLGTNTAFSPTNFSYDAFAFVPGRANGGPVSANKPYLVGEHGPELFMPRSNGSIYPSDALGAGGVQVGSVNITVQNTGEQLSPAAQKQIANQVQGIVMATLVNQKRSGGIL